ncbi:hypothetical protein QQX98_008887 [Neonectria punicea]|uniref:Uncharacterized protein n=1 Tax=Neonectria punicea TaxID=979145 RepID=A0ABR1GTY1_9HYPO
MSHQDQHKNSQALKPHDRRASSLPNDDSTPSSMLESFIYDTSNLSHRLVQWQIMHTQSYPESKSAQDSVANSQDPKFVQST